MSKHKHPRKKGKTSFSRHFQKFQSGDSVAVVQEMSVPFPYGKRLQGRTGKVLAKRGSAYDICISDLGKLKRYLLKPIHLTKIQNLP